MSKRGLKFAGPDGKEIPNYGEVDVDWIATEGHKCRMVIQMSDVDRCLLAATELNDAGNDVVLSKHGGEIIHVASGKRVALQRKGGVYVVKMWIKNNDVKGILKEYLLALLKAAATLDFPYPIWHFMSIC